jgi:hypothetical protein
MRISWPKESKLDFISEALTDGYAERFLGSEREAKLFRYSLYRLLNSYENGQRLIISLNGCKLTLTKPPNIMRKPQR